MVCAALLGSVGAMAHAQMSAPKTKPRIYIPAEIMCAMVQPRTTLDCPVGCVFRNVEQTASGPVAGRFCVVAPIVALRANPAIASKFEACPPGQVCPTFKLTPSSCAGRASGCAPNRFDKDFPPDALTTKDALTKPGFDPRTGQYQDLARPDLSKALTSKSAGVSR
jgi:hypothetical protein